VSRLAGKIALVTGSTSGIGVAIARRFLAEGASVMIHGPHPTTDQEFEGEVGYFGADLADPAACEALIEATLARFGGIDILVNNAAEKGRSDLETTDAALFDYMMAVNVRAPLLLTRAAAPAFRKRGGGSVLNIGSVNAYCGERYLLAYSISKGALLTITRNLADALGPDRIRVNQLNLGWILTPNEYEIRVREGMPKDWPQRLPVDYAPSGTMLTPEQVAGFGVAFVEDAGGFISGSIVELEQYPLIGRNPEKVI